MRRIVRKGLVIGLILLLIFSGFIGILNLFIEYSMAENNGSAEHYEFGEPLDFVNDRYLCTKLNSSKPILDHIYHMEVYNNKIYIILFNEYADSKSFWM